MARIDTSRAQTKTQRQTKQRAAATKRATAQARVNAARTAANKIHRPGRAAPKAKTAPRRIARETRVDRIV